jgi:hypothetical protein
MLHLLPGSLGLDLGVKLTDLTLSILANKNAPSLVWGNPIFEIQCYHDPHLVSNFSLYFNIITI